jgi:hypothetical protein
MNHDGTNGTASVSVCFVCRIHGSFRLSCLEMEIGVKPYDYYPWITSYNL